MPAIFVLSPEPLAGKTTIAVGLAQRITAEGKSVSLTRLGEDDNALTDTATFAAISKSQSADVLISEVTAGDSGASVANTGGARIVVATVATPPAVLGSYCKVLGGSFAGVVVNRVPQRRLESTRTSLEAAGVRAIAIVLEDRVLAAPTLAEVASALNAEVSFLNGAQLRPVDRPLISSISADPGEGYFSRHSATAVIVRSDKPDLQLAALNAGANCLIVTGGLPILSYVLERVEADEIPLLRTKFDTVETVKTIEALFAAAPFAAGETKLRRISELLGDLNVAAIV